MPSRMAAAVRLILHVTKVSPQERTFVVEQDAIRGMQAVGFAVVHDNQIGTKLGSGVRRARIEGRRLALRNFLNQSVKLGSRRLIEARLLFPTENADGFEKPKSADAVSLDGVFGRFRRVGPDRCSRYGRC